jgi:hypothetical protein
MSLIDSLSVLRSQRCQGNFPGAERSKEKGAESKAGEGGGGGGGVKCAFLGLRRQIRSQK